jgi:hypothetical protein
MRPQLKDLGPYYGKEPHSSELLILTESFYLEFRDKEVDPDTWYAQGTSMLNEFDRSYLNYDNIMRNKLPDGRWKERGCAIYRNLESALRDAGYPFIHNMLDHCTIANCFLRPAINGQSLMLRPVDIEVAKEFVSEIDSSLRPKMIICASSKSFAHVVRHLKIQSEVVKVCHPASQWWNRDGGKHGRQKFINAARENLSNQPS